MNEKKKPIEIINTDKLYAEVLALRDYLDTRAGMTYPETKLIFDGVLSTIEPNIKDQDKHDKYINKLKEMLDEIRELKREIDSI